MRQQPQMPSRLDSPSSLQHSSSSLSALDLSSPTTKYSRWWTGRNRHCPRSRHCDHRGCHCQHLRRSCEPCSRLRSCGPRPNYNPQGSRLLGRSASRRSPRISVAQVRYRVRGGM